ncbi:hypothetical protein [Rhizobium halophytocola]|uniref:Uncharacterized protein n=1 Tax=Rhizobium halophytocola TaxID=735519 RepID=A0ABS4E3M1_9HYPH|nr:hypothetical protein [Rhizobium halophytocola]MBP1852545.1 hypothetical protein [Rhizobium halophytocola]
MPPALYADLIADLRLLFTELDQTPDRFQTYDVHLELAAAGNVMVYETKRRKGLTDSLYYGRSVKTGTNQQISQATAFAAIERFLALGAFVALADSPQAGTVPDADYPHCAVRFAYRKKGAPKTRSLDMVFVGFNDKADALAYVETSGRSHAFKAAHPDGQDAHDWR